MIACPNMILIGAASRNVGKTEYACELIRRYKDSHLVVGVKITTIKPHEGLCPRGGEGCGACNLEKQDYCISEEILTDNEKDTTRMLRAGAHRVLWLRVNEDHLVEGVADLLGRIPEDALVVCESNSARKVLEPGVFVVLRQAGSTAVKASCQAVMHHADRVVEFHGDGWDFRPERIAAVQQHWILRPEATAVILAGGQSRRMGQDKSLMDLDGRPMIAHIASQLDYFPEILVGANDPDRYAFLELPVIPDQEPGKGPLMGILSCLERASHDLCFVTGCDIPSLDAGFVLKLLAEAEHYDIVMPRWPDGKVEPLLAVYRKTVIPAARAVLQRGGRRIVELFDLVRIRFVDAESLGWYANLNTRDDVTRWKNRGESAV